MDELGVRSLRHFDAGVPSSSGGLPVTDSTFLTGMTVAEMINFYYAVLYWRIRRSMEP